MAVYLTGYTAGDLYVAGFTDGALETPLGKFDGVLTKYSLDHSRTWTRHFGTPDDDAADPFAEANLYLTTTPTRVHLSGLTNTDVFHTTFTRQARTRPHKRWWAPRPRSGRASHGRTAT